MKQQFFSLVSVVLAVSACTAKFEDANNFQEGKIYTLSANVEADDTKATIVDGAFKWTENDQISVYGSNGKFNTFTLAEGYMKNGIDNTIWPRPRTYSIRLNVNF